MLLRTTLAAALTALSLAAQSNVLVNGDAEAGTLAGWIDPINGGFNLSASEVHGGSYSFQPGIAGPTGPHSQELRQDVDVRALAAAIDGRRVTSSFTGWGRTNSAGGATDPGHTVLHFLDASGTALATYDTNVFSPFNAWQSFSDTRRVPAGTRTLRVRLLGSRSVGVSTDCFFDDMVLALREWETVGSGCPGAAGVPGIALQEAPWLGGTYRLAVSNLAGGFAFMATGLAPQNVPLQPLGFGAACNLLVTTEVVLPLPQAGGTATWSLAIPANPAFAGISLWSQVLEIGAPASVSAAAHAVLR